MFWLTTSQLGRKELLDDPKGNTELPLASCHGKALRGQGILEVCAFCSLQGAYCKKAREVTLLCVFGFLKLSVGAFNSGGKQHCHSKSHSCAKKKGGLGKKRRLFCLRKQTKAAQLKLAAHSRAREQRCRGLDGCPSSQSIIPIHQKWESNLASQPAHQQGLTCTQPTPIPASCSVQALSKLPKILWALCRGRVFAPCWDGHHSGGTCCILTFSWDASDYFREKTVSWNTPG